MLKGERESTQSIIMLIYVSQGAAGERDGIRIR